MNDFRLACVLFDLDGTLVDTAPDLIACLNRALSLHGFEESSELALKPLISKGAMPMIEHAAPGAGTELKDRLLADMLDCYENNIAEHSRFYAGILDALETIENLGLKWGVVTNKRERFTLPLMAALKLNQRAACIVSGDTTPYPKPHPQPMLEACRRAGVEPENCVFIGDALHDITAGKNVNMKTLAAVYGYVDAGDRPENWGADALIEHPRQLLQWINSSSCR